MVVARECNHALPTKAHLQKAFKMQFCINAESYASFGPILIGPSKRHENLLNRGFMPFDSLKIMRKFHFLHFH
jgi:hypothetical protein